MKRVRADETVKEGSSSGVVYRASNAPVITAPSIVPYQNHQPQHTHHHHSSSNLNSGTLKIIGGVGGDIGSTVMQSSLYPVTQPVNYGTISSVPSSHSGKQSMQPITITGHSQVRNKGESPSSGGTLCQQQQSPGSNSNNTFQRLKVEDALSYLDTVKYKFGEKPQVYNDFLDIMKEFKTQSIDTPGVIARVSSLFNGYPELIVGFNTFLPPGYKIEVQKNDQGYAFQVSVSVPSPTGGGVMMNDSSGHNKPSTILCGSGTIIHSNISSSNVHGSGSTTNCNNSSQQQLSLGSNSTVTHVVPNCLTSSVAPLPLSQATVTQTSSVLAVAANNPSNLNHGGGGGGGGSGGTGGGGGGGVYGGPPLTQHSPSVLSLHGNSASGNVHNNTLTLSAAALQSNVDTPQNQPVEFNHAINYVNKIKNRFQGQPEKYKRFLEILHAYQKEQRTLKEASQCIGPGKHLTEQEVYAQVAKLFENQSDLLAEFGQFLPDATSHMSGGGGSANLVAVSPLVEPHHHHPPHHHQHHHHVAAPATGANTTVSSAAPNAVSASSAIIAPSGGGVLSSSAAVVNKKPVLSSASATGGVVNMVGGGGGGGSGGASGGGGGGGSKPYHHHATHHHREHTSERHVSHKSGHISSQMKRSSPPYSGGGGGGGGSIHRGGSDVPPAKKHKLSTLTPTVAMATSSSALNRDVTISDAAKHATLNDYAFFDKLRKAVKSQEVYNNFLRCLILFNQEIVSKSELVQLVTPFLGKFPELMRWFRDFLGQSDVEPIPFNVVRNERPQGDQALDIDYSTAKRLGASYCVIPPAQEHMRFSGRTQLCHEVLNNQWVSFPTWSEDSSFVGSRKNQYEEYMYRCEDERFELDVVIETNASTIRALEGITKKLSRMSPDELNKYQLEDHLSGSLHVLHHKALKRIYGDKAPDIIDGLKRNPAVAVSVVLRRLKAKEEEWREAQKGFNKVWRDQNEKYYLKSLDYQGINFKQADVKALRSKSMFGDIESLFEERNEHNEEGVQSESIQGPHMTFRYQDRTLLDDAANLLIHHVKRQTGIQKTEKRRIKHILRQFVPDLFFHPRQQLSDDERDDDDEGNESPQSTSSKEDYKSSTKGGSSSPGKSPGRADCTESSEDKNLDQTEIKDEDTKVPLHAQSTVPDESYTFFMANNNWYLFLRLHATLCDRLSKIYERAVIIAQEEADQRNSRKESTAIALRLKPKPTIEIDEYYPAFLDMVKNLLDGNMDANTYEDTLREMFGIHAFIAFTLDKVVTYAVRQLQHCVTERTASTCMNVFIKEQKRGSTGGPCLTAHRRFHNELQYQRMVEHIMHDDNCFKIYIYKQDGRMTVEMTDAEAEEPKKVDEVKKWNQYKEDFSEIPTSENANSESNKPLLPLYLNRNLRKRKKRFSTPSNMSEQLKNEKVVKRDGSRLIIDDKTAEEGEEDDDDNIIQSIEGRKRLMGLTSTKTTLPTDSMGELERNLNQRGLPERSLTAHPGYDIHDETQCSFNLTDAKALYTANKESFLYKTSAFYRAKQSHAGITKRLAERFRMWLRMWASKHITDSQAERCTDWLMGRCTGNEEGDTSDIAPNHTWIQTDNDLRHTPYVPYNRYRVRLLISGHDHEDAT